MVSAGGAQGKQVDEVAALRAKIAAKEREIKSRPHTQKVTALRLAMLDGSQLIQRLTVMHLAPAEQPVLGRQPCEVHAFSSNLQ